MKRRATRIGASLAALAAFALGGAAIASATGGGDESQLTSSEAARAAVAALRATGGGEVQASERDGEDGATYEVEVRKRDGSVVDVRLDDAYRVVVVEGDEEQGDRDDADER